MNFLSSEQPKTPEEIETFRRNAVRGRARQLAQQAYNALVQTQKEGMKFLWQNRQGLTPQEVADIMGTNAVKALQLHSVLTQAIIAAAAIEGIKPDILWPSRKWTENPDGTITILDQPYEIPQ